MNPCPQCGAPLRWVAEAGTWNCDRCGNRIAPSAAPPQTPPPGPQGHPGGYPPQGQPQGYPPQGYPPQGYPPQGYPHPGYPPRAGGGKGKLIAILVVVAALAAGGIVLAVVLSKRGSGGGGGFAGAESSEGLAKTFVETLATGDGEKLAALAPGVDTMLGYVECPAEQLEKSKADYAEQLKRSREAAPHFKDRGLAYKGIEPMGAPTEMKVGDAVGDACKAKKAFSLANYTVEFEYDAPDKSKKTFKTNMFTYVLDGKHWLSPGHVAKPDDLGGAGTPPTTPPTTDPAAPAGDMTALTAEVEAIRAAACACTDKPCADTQWDRLMKFVEANKPALQEPGALKANELGSETIKCLDKLRLGSTAPTPPAEPSAGGGAIPECVAYLKAVEKFAGCSKVPKESRDAVKGAVAQMEKTWTDPSLTPEMRASMAQTCKTSEDGMRKAAAQLGCK